MPNRPYDETASAVRLAASRRRATAQTSAPAGDPLQQHERGPRVDLDVERRADGGGSDEGGHRGHRDGRQREQDGAARLGAG